MLAARPKRTAWTGDEAEEGIEGAGRRQQVRPPLGQPTQAARPIVEGTEVFAPPAGPKLADVEKAFTDRLRLLWQPAVSPATRRAI